MNVKPNFISIRAPNHRLHLPPRYNLNCYRNQRHHFPPLVGSKLMEKGTTLDGGYRIRRFGYTGYGHVSRPVLVKTCYPTVPLRLTPDYSTVAHRVLSQKSARLRYQLRYHFDTVATAAPMARPVCIVVIASGPCGICVGP